MSDSFGSSKSSSSVSSSEECVCVDGSCGEVLWEWDGSEWFIVTGDCDQFDTECCTDVPGTCGVFVGQQLPNNCLCNPLCEPISCTTEQPTC